MWKKMLKTCLVLGVLLSFVCVPAFAAQVDSADISIADGVTGQNTQSGDGVKTDHIQDGAVTASKLASGAVVSDKISGSIGVEKLSSYVGVRVVHKGACDNVNTFNSIGSAIASIVDESDTNRYLVKVMPGVYDEKVVMVPYVDISGSGQSNTIITSSSDRNTLVAIKESSLSDVTITTNPNTGSYGVVATAPEPSINNGKTIFRNVTVRINGGATVGVHVASGSYSIYAFLPVPLADIGFKFINSRVISESDSDFGILNYDLGTEIVGSNIYVSNATGGCTGILSSSRDFWVRNSYVEVESDGMHGGVGIQGYSSGVGSISNSRIVVNDNNTTTTIKPVGIYSNHLTVVNSQIEVNAQGVEEAYGIYSLGVTVLRSSVISSHAALNTGGNMAEIDNSLISGVTNGIVVTHNGAYTLPGSFMVGNSKIVGGHNGNSSDRIVNCYDENYAKIADQ
jgi:hypothetical protein